MLRELIMKNGSNQQFPPGDPEDKKIKFGKTQRQLLVGIGVTASILLIIFVISNLITSTILQSSNELSYSEFKQLLSRGEIVQVEIGENIIRGERKNPTPQDSQSTKSFSTMIIMNGDPSLIPDLQKAGIPFSFITSSSGFGQPMLIWLLIIGGLTISMVLFSRRESTPPASNLFQNSKSKTPQVKSMEIDVTFQDVGGADEAIIELQEIIQFLKSPEKFARLGGRIPKGVLLVGPPGTGKTLLAKAVAGEANVYFFDASGSEFVEMYVGIGAARIRDLFKKAREAAPSVVFIDEIDSIGQRRGGINQPGSNDEREQTLNQLLAEIDGFKSNSDKPVIVLAATNRPEILDPALLRAGRFDRQITVDPPDLLGRIQILKIHSRNILLTDDFNIDRAARITAGLSGADLENIFNEAALFAARRDAERVSDNDFNQAIERVIAGFEKPNRKMNELTKATVAYHEAGHALVAELLPFGDPVSKISIIPRSRGALGYTLHLPEEDRYLMTLDELQDQIAVMMGGRAAEEIKFGTISTGAADDISRATELASRIVTEFGMSESLGTVRYASAGSMYLGGSNFGTRNISPKTAEMIDQEIKKIINGQYQRTQKLLRKHRHALESLAQRLLDQETVDGCEVKQVLGLEDDCIEF